MRVYSGLPRKAFGELFDSKESTVYQWECGRCIPRLSKLIAISTYFDVSLDSILSGRVKGSSMLEKRLDSVDALDTPDFTGASYTGRLMAGFNSLPDSHKERLMGYLDALSKEDNPT